MRTANRVASLLLAAVLLVGGALVATEALLAVLGRPGLLLDRTGWYDTLTTTRRSDSAVRIAATAAVLLGIAILVAQLRRWTPVRLRLDERDGWHLHRRSVERRLAAAAAAVPGVRHATVRVRRREAGWRPRVRASGNPAAQAEVEFAVRRELHRLGSPGPIEVRLHPRRRAA
jgi:hypothetical protein